MSQSIIFHWVKEINSKQSNMLLVWLKKLTEQQSHPDIKHLERSDLIVTLISMFSHEEQQNLTNSSHTFSKGDCWGQVSGTRHYKAADCFRLSSWRIMLVITVCLLTTDRGGFVSSLLPWHLAANRVQKRLVSSPIQTTDISSCHGIYLHYRLVLNSLWFWCWTLSTKTRAIKWIKCQ